jgi:hypothetical protein
MVVAQQWSAVRADMTQVGTIGTLVRPIVTSRSSQSATKNQVSSDQPSSEE